MTPQATGSPLGYFHYEGDVCFVVQQCAAAGYRAVCGAMVQEASAGGAKAPGGFIGFMEMFIMMVNDDII